MASKQFMYEIEARQKLLKGVETLARTVKSTLGPSGHGVILGKSFGAPQITNDGVTVAKDIELEDPFENMGAKLMQQVASKTNDQAGDGTTTASVIAEAMLKEGLKVVASGVNPIALKNGIDKGVAAALETLEGISRKVKNTAELEAVASVSANHDRVIGKLIAEAIEKVGKEGVVTIEEGSSTETELDYVDGLRFDKGYLSPYFVNEVKTMEVVMDKPLMLFVDKKITNLRELLPLLEKAVQSGKPLLIVAEDIEGEALSTLVINRLQGRLNICAVKAPGFGDRRKQTLDDMAVVTGGVVVSDESGISLENLEIDQLGTARKIVVSKDDTIVIEGAGSKKAINARAESLRAQMDNTDSTYDREKLAERLAKIIGGVAVIRVGGLSETEMKERKFRVEDAFNATKAAYADGIVAGGGTAYLRMSAALDAVKAKGDEKLGVSILRKALLAPCAQIATNAGYNGDVVVSNLLEKGTNVGFNAIDGSYGDMFKAEIIDPTKVARCAVINAASVAGTVLTTNIMVTELKGEAITGAEV